jgi:hypothetical protein
MKFNVYFLTGKGDGRMGLEGELGIYRQGHADISPEGKKLLFGIVYG